MKVFRLSDARPQRIRIGPDITLSLLSVEGGRVRVAIDAPQDVRLSIEDEPPTTGPLQEVASHEPDAPR